MMLSHIGSVLKQAIITFTCKREIRYENVELLKTLLDKTTAADINLNPEFSTERLWKRPGKAPVTYIDIFEDENMTIGVFILKPGMKLPLHDHPQMHGMIKVISGKVKITSYSLNTERIKEINLSGNIPATRNSQYSSDLLIAECISRDIFDVNSETCSLGPQKGNIHEIESIDGPAAFIDILSPPYETVIPNVGERKCNYYSILSQVAPNIYKLMKISSPSWYWTDCFPYSGPDISSIFK